ncbi:hypothetical protein Bbelb_372860, partial [Branchiostoma belcheri]
RLLAVSPAVNVNTQPPCHTSQTGTATLPTAGVAPIRSDAHLAWEPSDPPPTPSGNQACPAPLTVLEVDRGSTSRDRRRRSSSLKLQQLTDEAKTAASRCSQ